MGALSREAKFDHGREEYIGVLLTNLGTPASCHRSDVRRFLKQFLWDRRVVEVPRLIWWAVLNLVILNTRPKRSAAAYAKIWTDEGSPLMTISQRQLGALRDQLDDPSLKIALAMRYGKPSLEDGLKELRQQGASRILVLPLYPQYSATTTATTFDEVTRLLRARAAHP